MPSHPTFGVEEEFLLADPATGEPVAVNKAVASHAAEHVVKLQLELTSCQVETTTEVISGSDELRKELARLRRVAAEAAALEVIGDYDMVHAELEHLDYQGNGAMRQRQAWHRRHDVKDVIAELAAATLS
jgi:Glutamate-cysteine ligase family 2(GCS2)